MIVEFEFVAKEKTVLIRLMDRPVNILFYSMPLEGQTDHKNMDKMWIKCDLFYIIICMYIVCIVRERKEHMKNTCRVY